MGASGDGSGEAGRGFGAALMATGASVDAFASALLDTVPTFVALTDVDGVVLEVNRLPAGLDASAVLGRSLFDLAREASHSNIRACLEVVRRTHAPSSYDVVGAIPGLVDRDARVRVGPVLADGELRGLVVVISDVTARKEGERALREQEEKLRLAVEATRMGLWSWDLLENAVQWDARVCEIYGRPAHPTDYEEWQRCIHPDDFDRVMEGVQRAVQTGVYEPLEHRLVRPNGELRWVYCCAIVVREGGRVARLTGGILDITERRVIEERLRLSQKMDAVGQLTSGVAHNFNNMLAGMLPVLEVVERKVEEPWRSRVGHARHAGQRAAEMVRQLMTFATPGRVLPRSRASLVELVERAVGMCREAIGPSVDIVSTLTGSSSPVVLANAGEVEQVLVNVLFNARDALETVNGATVRLSLTELPGTDEELVDRCRRANATPIAPGTRVARLRVVDNGIGMPPDVLRRIFDPFFTTKEVGRGTGLGLATAYAIVRDHGGFIWCDSTAGLGTTFDIFLPTLTRQDESSEPHQPALARVLVVDDDATVRTVVAEVLREHGFLVSTAEGGRGALESVMTTDPQLLVLDYTMPGTSGAEVAREVRRLRPDMRIVMFTGRVAGDVEASAADAVLAKPASADAIVDVVVRTLAAPRRALHP
ncbi:MAG: PAS domain S-box protein [Polyangiaceae bacterium]|nr:PAS domain S-box protein [Polyangiaceae bacterium]